jgi:hypothetical protein
MVDTLGQDILLLDILQKLAQQAVAAAQTLGITMLSNRGK